MVSLERVTLAIMASTEVDKVVDAVVMACTIEARLRLFSVQ